jgi:D-alanyl-lipoteichoic acid acyltransferase DltB (MBOAT superfamily)
VNPSLLSAGFIELAIGSVVLLSTLRSRARQIAFLTLNAVFVAGFILGPASAAATLLFALLGYLFARLPSGRARGVLVLGVVLCTALFVYMRGYGVIRFVIPEELFPRLLSTVGLSFLFFKMMHVMVDAHAGTLGRLDLLTYLNYCFNFTTFLMGPIQRYQDHRAQWHGEKPAIPLDFDSHLNAGLRVLWGFIKAYVLAGFFQDRALHANTDLLSLTAVGLVVQTYAFWFYLYLNFSGYCDVVIGIGSLLGIRPPENFNKPYLARNISDFWQRQHRTLTLWLTDYVFTPMYRKLISLGATRGHRRLAVNVSLMSTMLVSGLWHGTTISFLLFGVVHGMWFIIYRTWDDLLTRRLGKAEVQRMRQKWWARAGGIFLTFNATAFAFVFFQVNSEQVMRALTALVRA